MPVLNECNDDALNEYKVDDALFKEHCTGISFSMAIFSSGHISRTPYSRYFLHVRQRSIGPSVPPTPLGTYRN